MTIAVAREQSSTEAGLLALAGLGIVVANAAGPYLLGRFGGFALWAVVLVTAATAAWAAWFSTRISSRHALAVVIGVAIALRLGLLLVEPQLSSDVYRYIWDGRVQAAGINPYRFVPAAPELTGLRDAAIYPSINRADYAPTIYPPAAQMFFLAATRLGESVLAMKLGLLAFEAVGVACLVAILRILGKPAGRVAAYAWHPLPVWEIAGNGHVDAVLVGLMLLALWSFLIGSRYVAGILTGIATLVKPTALLLAPVLWRPWHARLPLLIAAVIGLLYLPYLSAGSAVLGFLPGYLTEEELLGGVGLRYLGLIEHWVGPMPYGGPVYLVLAGVALAALAIGIAFRADRSPAASVHGLALLLTAFLLLLTPHYPWYYLVLVPFLAIERSATLWVLTVGGFALYDVVPGDVLPSFELRDSAFRIAALLAVAYDVMGSRRTAPVIVPGVARQ